ncbi:hypothetical protein OZL92_05545 [Bacillus sonorensis]|uniref:Uncharacterized protein n=1 Tax=Bacillus sonorensis TaxID=119858 RepID=A0ABM6LHZ0_9BACI|nr:MULTISPECIES: hypothetical protein [Bacillus]TWK82323.1 hypothetical protein CHCC20335_3366 [Bacillus paralicheniformis]ASB88925.1 hypothetical protein S101395_02418 [Bacillus sonorensis]MCZ0067942.1 hypothetical protein [Bacillus sonorensis]MCZ0072231.1 hypothetical protein [Bacillus sonorensis]MCZ0090851.1 hypothetical protein [Bacillus sonorensis]
MLILVILAGFIGTIITILRTIVKQNNRIIDLLEEKTGHPPNTKH